MPSDSVPDAPLQSTDEAPGDDRVAMENVIIALNRIWTDTQLYPEGHPMVEQHLAEAQEALARLLEVPGEAIVKNIDGDLVYDGQRLFAHGTGPATLIGAMARKNVGFMRFVRGLATSDLKALCEALAVDSEEADDGGPAAYLSATGADHVELGELGVLYAGEVRPGGNGGGVGFSGVSLIELYHSAMDVARETLQAVRADQPLDVEGSEGVVDQLVARVTEDSSAAIGLACLKGHDEYTFSHCVHVALLTMALGEAIGLEAEELRELGMATMLHDVGKVLIPLEVLRKPGKLTDEEWDLMRRHPADGAAILLEYPDLPASAPAVALEHHIHVDMSGYPEVPGKQELGFFSMMVAVADVYDALTTYRPYRPAMRPDEAVAEMGNMPEGKFEPQLADWFRQMLGVYPPGTCVELDTGECAVVCRCEPSEPSRPDVCIVADEKGDPITGPYEASLSEKGIGGAGFRRSITRAIAPDERGIDPAEALGGWVRRHCSPMTDAS